MTYCWNYPSKNFNKDIEFKKCFHGLADAGYRLLSGTHWLNKELGRHRGREQNKECKLCGNECKSISRVLWECWHAIIVELTFRKARKWVWLLWCISIGKSSFVLVNELGEDHFDSLLRNVLSMSEKPARKNYMLMIYPSLSPQLGIWRILRGTVMWLCVREVILTLVNSSWCIS